MVKGMVKKKSMLLVLLFLILLVLASVYFLLIGDKEEKIDSIIASQLDLDSIAQISYEYDERIVEITKSGELWILNADKNFPLSQKQVKTMVYATTNITAERIVDESADNYERFGLESPDITIWITDKDGDTITYLISNYDMDSNLYYFSVQGSGVYLIKSTLYSWFSQGLYDLIEMDAFPETDKGDVNAFKIESDIATLEIAYYKDSSGMSYDDDSNWYLKKEDGKLRAAHTAFVEDLLADILRLSPVSCTDYEALGEELPYYGLDVPRATISISATVPYFISIGNLDESGLNYFIMNSVSPMVYLINCEDVDQILGKTATDLISKQICQVKLVTVQQLYIEYDGNIYNMQIEWDKKDSVSCKVNSIEVDSDVFLEFYDSITGLTREGWAEESTDNYDDTPYLSIIFYRNTEDFSQMMLNLYQYDKSFYFVKFDGINNSLVGKLDVAKIIEKLDALK